MRVVLAFLRASALTAASYRLNALLSYAGILLGVIPLYFVASALQPVMQDAIRHEGGQYFGFLLMGTSTFYLIPTAVNALPTAVTGAVANGTLETVLVSPAPLGTVLAGMVSYETVTQLLRIAVLFVAGALLGAPIHWAHLPQALFVLALIAASYVPFALFTAALVVAFRTTARLPLAVLTVTSLLGGVYYPTHVIPSWLERLSEFVPLTYGLRALRRVVLGGVTLAGVAQDLAVVVATTAGLGVAAAFAFHLALRHARRAGTLGVY
jgi:ABC-2 type transport system permease protein